LATVVHILFRMHSKLFQNVCSIVSFFYIVSAIFGQAPNPALQLRVSTEHVVAGGMAQVKVFLTTPAPVASGYIPFRFDRNAFGDVAAATVFSANGDAYGGVGTIDVDPGWFSVSFTSPSGGSGVARCAHPGIYDPGEKRDGHCYA
jgi:hypothetical protein